MATIWKTTKGELILNGPDVEAILSRELFGLSVEVCSFCGRRQAAAFWQGVMVVSVCRECALVVLPRLMADAVVGEGGASQAGLLAAAANMLRTYSRAVGLALKRVAEVAARGMPRRKWPPGASVN